MADLPLQTQVSQPRSLPLPSPVALALALSLSLCLCLSLSLSLGFSYMPSTWPGVVAKIPCLPCQVLCSEADDAAVRVEGIPAPWLQGLGVYDLGFRASRV